MLTSESNDQEFHELINRYAIRLRYRITDLVENRYRRAIVLATQKGLDIPPVVGNLKITDDMSLYGCVFGVKFRRNDFDVKAFVNYLIMRDLRKQTKIMVAVCSDSVIVYNTHAVQRFKERLALEEDMTFAEVCKHMITVGGCGSPKIIKCLGQIYGENPNHTEIKIICLKGAFLGYYSEQTNVLYAETFLSSNEMKESQAFMDVTKDPAWHKWKQQEEMLLKGKLRSEEMEDMFDPSIGLDTNEGSLKFLSEAETRQRQENFDKFLAENPDYKTQMIEENRQKKEARLKRKGIK